MNRKAVSSVEKVSELDSREELLLGIQLLLDLTLLLAELSVRRSYPRLACEIG